MTTETKTDEINFKKILYYSIDIHNYDEVLKTIFDSLKKVSEPNSVYALCYQDKDDTVVRFSNEINKDTFTDEEKEKFTESSDVLLHRIKTKFGDKISPKDKFLVLNDNLYKLNDAFHITTLYTGGKKHEKQELCHNVINRPVECSVEKISVSDKFIAIGVSSIDFPKTKDAVDELIEELTKTKITDDVKVDTDVEPTKVDNVPYFGNEVKHITVGISKMGPTKLFPKDSYLSLQSDESKHVLFDVNTKLDGITQCVTR